MINALTQSYPTSLVIDGIEYEIDTDFRRWVGLSEALISDETSSDDKFYLIYDLFTKNKPRNEGAMLEAVAMFLSGNDASVNEQKSIKKEDEKASKKQEITFSFTYDCDYIIGAFLECYKLDLINIKYLHWFHFKALLNALNPNCEFKQRIAYRMMDLSKIKDRKERARIKKIQDSIRLPIKKKQLSDETIANAFL